jgi:hypothetical protein
MLTAERGCWGGGAVQRVLLLLLLGLAGCVAVQQAGSGLPVIVVGDACRPALLQQRLLDLNGGNGSTRQHG